MIKWTPEQIHALRERFGQSQADFCHRLRIKIDTLRRWEQGKGPPSGPAQELLDRLEKELMEVAK